MIIGCFLNVAIDSWIIIQYSNNAIALLRTGLYGTPVLLANNRKTKLVFFFVVPLKQRGEEQAASSELFGNKSPGVFVEKKKEEGGIGISLFIRPQTKGCLTWCILHPSTKKADSCPDTALEFDH